MTTRRRSNCPISFTLDLIGDRWSLLILRDLVFGRARFYRQLLESGEGIATNVLAERLRRLERVGLLSKRRDPDDRKRFIYSLTPKGLDTLPILLEMILWGAKYDPRTAAPPEFVARLRKDRERVLAEVRARAEEK
ncbi:MAG TPA: helix-turn-helix domain-containing protein [Candidatus Krumholzibacteria bacterium]|nr:helix-turn-helix domain-containing protein [Candidatus Krumholzibacteria bacterium]